MSIPQPEPWLRGPLAGIPPPLQPAAHAFVMSIEDCEGAVRDRPADKRRAAEWNVHSRLALAVVWID